MTDSTSEAPLRRARRSIVAALLGLTVLSAHLLGQSQEPSNRLSAARPDTFRYPVIPLEYSRLDNGLKVVLARDITTPVVVIGVYYGTGQRLEPRGRDSLATSPVLAIAFHMPERDTRAFYAMAIIDQLALQANKSWIPRTLVEGRHLADGVFGGANLQGHMFNYRGPMLWTVAVSYSALTRTDTIVDAVQQTLDRLATQPIDGTTLALARHEAKSSLYDILDYLGGFGKADMLASYALFDDDPNKINALEPSLDRVTADDVMATAREYLNASRRTVYVRRPPAGGGVAPGRGN